MNATPQDGAARGPRTRRIVAVGLVAAGLSVVGAGVATAAAPTSPVSRTVAGALHAAGVDWSAMPAGYTRAEYEAFWGAGYSAEDADALSVLWKTDLTEAKAKAGQMILDGESVPIAPGSTTSTEPTDAAAAAYNAFWAAGYSADDLQKLSDLWNLDPMEAKAKAGQLLIDGRSVPIAPSGN